MASKRKTSLGSKDSGKVSSRKQCSAIFCNNYQFSNPELAFHRFPKDPVRCAIWVRNLRNASLDGISTERLHENYRVCSAHFQPGQFRRPADVHAGLNWDAVPTRVEIPNQPLPPDAESGRKPPKKRQALSPTKGKQSHETNLVSPVSVEQHTDDTVQAGPSAPLRPSQQSQDVLSATERALKMKVRYLQKEVCRLRSKVRELNSLGRNTKVMGVSKESVLKEMKKHLSPEAYALFSTQMHMSQRKAHGARWTNQDKTFFLSLLHANPECYKLLCKFFMMPSVCTLRRVMKTTDFKPGLNQNTLVTAKKAAETMKPIDKVCAIITDEMSLKQSVDCKESDDRIDGCEDFDDGQRTLRVANYASAFMVQGLFRKWKQAFGYCFTSGPINHTRLESLLLGAVSELREAGLDCMVFICDQAAGNEAMLSHLGVTKERPYFHVDGARVFCLWDPPHLIKDIRNNWRDYGFSLDDDCITWDILEDLFAYDSKQDIRMCCRLSRKHVYLTPSASTRVGFAAQVLSHSVAVGIKTLAEIKQLTGQTCRNFKAAATFCENFDGIFNCFNSKQLKDSHKLKSAISEVSAHLPFLDKCMEWLPRLKLVGAPRADEQVPCVEGWQHNIVCLKMIWEDLRERYQVSYLLTNRLNQDCLQNAFSDISGRVGHSPDSEQFESEYKAVAAGLMFNNSEKTNCDEDLDSFLQQVGTYTTRDSRIHTNTELIRDDHSYALETEEEVTVLGDEGDQTEEGMNSSHTDTSSTDDL